MTDQIQQEVNEQYPPTISRQKQVGLFFVAGVGVLAAILGGAYVWRHLMSPFEVDYTGPRFYTNVERQQQLLAEQQATDSDGDTLSDYDELYTYQTSPYLADTDGDGDDDATELLNGTDPSCAHGSSCTIVEEYNALAGIEGLLGDGTSETDQAATQEQSIDVVAELLKNLDASQIRSLLIDAGAGEETINELSDEEVVALYTEVLRDLESSGQLDELLTGSVDTDVATETITDALEQYESEQNQENDDSAEQDEEAVTP